MLERIAKSTKPFTVCFLGQGELALPPNARRAARCAKRPNARSAMVALAPGFVARTPLPPSHGGKRVRGLYCGGTLCAEAQIVLLDAGEAVQSNAPVPGAAQRMAHRGRTARMGSPASARPTCIRWSTSAPTNTRAAARTR